MNKMRNWFYNQKGQGTVEYLLVIAVIVVVVVGAGAMFSNEIKDIFLQVKKVVLGAMGG